MKTPIVHHRSPDEPTIVRTLTRLFLLGLTLAALFLSVSCTVMGGRDTAGTPATYGGEEGAHKDHRAKPAAKTFFYASLGGDADGLKISATEASATKINNSATAKSLIRTVGTAVAAAAAAEALKSGNEILQSGMTSRHAATETTTRSIAAGKEATNQAKIAAEAAEAAAKAAP